MAATTQRDTHITETAFWNELCHDVFGPRKGGAIVFVDAENARKGVAKTSAAVALARLFARAFGYQLEKDDFTLSGAQYLRRYQEHPGQEQPSVLVLDEFVGAGSGDARRAMSTQNVDFGSAWQMLRSKRVVTFATLPDWNEADPRLQKYADYRVWCRERPIGQFQAYKIETPFNAGGSGPQVRTRGLGDGATTQRISFPNMDAHNDPFYNHLTELKDEVIHSRGWDADQLLDDDAEADEETIDPDTLERQQAIKYALRLYRPWVDNRADSNCPSLRDVAQTLYNGEYSPSWVSERVNEWRDGEHRDLVADPRE